jgi:hypothetical protein
VPASDGTDDFVRISGPREGLRLGIVFDDEAIDGGLQIDDRDEDAALQSPPGEFCEEDFAALSHEHDVGVKWNVKRSCRLSHRRALGCLWAA